MLLLGGKRPPASGPPSPSLLALALSLSPRLAAGHGYLASPRSRNFVAHQDGVWWPQSDLLPKPESEPQSANIGGVDARCGVIAGRNYDTPLSGTGGPLAPNVQACYQPGTEVILDVHLTAHHKGHFEFRLCPIAPYEVATQACFDAHPMTFVSDELHAGVPHPDYPDRAFIDPLGKDFKYRYKLPDDVSGDLILMQWHYVTANSCMHTGYDTYDWPAGWHPGNLPDCGPLPPDGRGVPEQFWNCAEIRIAADCDAPPPPPTTTAATTTQGQEGQSPASTTAVPPPEPTTTQAPPPPPPPAPTSCPQVTGVGQGGCGPNTSCAAGPEYCCGQWGYCGTTAEYCGTCCQNGACLGEPTGGGGGPPPPPPPPGPPAPPPVPGFNYNATHGEDSRLIAYVGNWQACPTPEQVDAYSHLVIAFAVSYTYDPAKNICDANCNVAPVVPICENANNQALVDSWRAAGKKVILSFGGAGMGGSWAGDVNDCWDYCFGNEDQLSTQLVDIVRSQNFDGIDLDYEYFTNLPAQQNFLREMTRLLREKMDDLGPGYELTHAPMDSDLVPTSNYYQILKERHADLDFLMPQFYNGYTRPALDGVDGTGEGSWSAADMFANLANDVFDGEPHKVVFGHCISDCSFTGSNANGAQAAQIMADLKTVNSGEFECNGGAFFWVANHDVGGAWSDSVVAEVSKTAGCSVPDPNVGTLPTSTTSATTTAAATTTEEPTTSSSTTSEATTTAPPPPTTEEPNTSSSSTTEATTAAPETSTVPATTTVLATTTAEETTTTPEATTTSEEPTTTEAVTTEAPPETSTVPATTTAEETTTTSGATSTTPEATTTSEEPTTTGAVTTEAPGTTTPSDGLVLDHQPRCGTSELDAREHCNIPCMSDADCLGEWCWSLHTNFCGSIPKRTYVNPEQSTVWARCGKTEVHARTFCGDQCATSNDCTVPGEDCWAIHSSYCGSAYTEDGDDVTPTEPNIPPTTTTAEDTTTTVPPTSPTTGELVVDQTSRCGTSELEARETCGSTCVHSGDCPSGQWCWGVHPNYCGSIPKRIYKSPGPFQSSVWTRCGTSEIDARTFCGKPCNWDGDCDGDSCFGINSNYCGSEFTEEPFV